MATGEKRVGTSGKTTWRVRVSRQAGPPLTKSFAPKSDADEWVRSVEHRIDSGEKLPTSEARKHTLADAMDRYLEVTLEVCEASSFAALSTVVQIAPAPGARKGEILSLQWQCLPRNSWRR